MNNSLILKLIIFTLLLNVATGLVTVGITDINGTRVFNKNSGSNSSQILAPYDPSYMYNFSTNMNMSVAPPNSQSSNSWRILDMINLGFMIKFFNAFQSSIAYGFPNMLEAIFGPALLKNNPDLYSMLFAQPFGLFYLLITIIYGIGLFLLITGRFIQK